MTRPILFHYIGETEKRREMAAAVFDGFAKGVLQADAPTVLPLAEAHKAHDLLESRAATTGVVLRP